MKKIVFLRHAKSSWEDLKLNDKDRSLNNRGRRDAPVMAEHLSTQLNDVEMIISSSATRTRETSQYFIDAFSIPESQVKYADALYACSPDDFLNELWLLPDNISNILLVGHNPTITQIGMLIDSNFMHDIPTCGLLITQSEVSEWSLVNFATMNLKHYFYPKGLK